MRSHFGEDRHERYPSGCQQGHWRQSAIKGHLSMIPIDMEPQPIILAYIDLNLQTLAAARMLTPSGPIGQTHWSDTASNSPNPTTHSADAQLKATKQYVDASSKKFVLTRSMKLRVLSSAPQYILLAMKQQELAVVFKKICDKQTCTIGLYELYRITQLYPKVEKNAAAGRTLSSLPMSTPPPLALNVSSPKLAPLSLVHTKSLNQNTENIGSNIPVSYSDDEAVGAGMLPTFRDRSNLSATGLSTGTLEAIRERMKSIQAAAAA